MKSKQTLLLLTLTILCVVYACREEAVDKNPIVEPDPITPDLTIKINSSVTGFVIDESGTPVVYANVAAGDKHTLTDEYGYFKIANASLSKIAGQVAVTKNGYFEGYKSFIPGENKETFIRLKLIKKIEAGIIEAASGGNATTADGATIALPPNGVKTASNNTAYTGQVHVSASIINSSDDSEFKLNMPGDSRGTDTDGHLKALKSFSLVAVELTGSNGQLLQIMDGKSATISLPIPTALVAEAPTSIALWYFDNTTGLWKQEGSATKTGNVYVGTVTHFSFWNGAEGLSLVNFTAHIVNEASQPLVNVPISINIAGMPKNAGHGRFGYTDANGNVTGAVFANVNLVLDILTPCATSAYSHEFSTTATDIDLGTLTGNLGQSIVTLSGTVSNCDSEPVASGYVQTYDNGFYNRINISNGNFNFTGLACTNTTVNVVAVDYATFEQNAPQSVLINPGANNLGALTACGTTTMGNITYTIDTVTTVILQEPTDTLAAYADTDQNIWTQIVTLSGDPNANQKMAFQFDGGRTVGSTHKLGDVFSEAFPSGRGYWPAPVTVNITEYGKVGGFISGNFSSYMLDFNDNSIHMLTCSFRVRRFN